MASVYIQLPLITSTVTGTISVAPSPIVYSLNGVDTEVGRDTGTPTNSRPLPVEIMSASGVDINITAGDINVQLSDLGVNFDRTRIGDGTNQLGINASTEALVHDADVLAQSVLLVAKDFSTSAKQDTQITAAGSTNTKLDSLIAKDFATQATLASLLTDSQAKADLSETQPVAELDNTASGTITTENLVVAGTATANSSVEIDTIGKEMVAVQVTGTYTGVLGWQMTINGTTWVATSGAFVQRVLDSVYSASISSGAQGMFRINCTGALKIRLSGISAVTGTATITMRASKGAFINFNPLLETTTTAMSAKLPATLGQKAMAASMAVVIASDQTAIPVSGTITATQGYVAGTLKAAQITVGTSAVRATTDGSAPSATRNKLMIKPNKSNTGAIFLIPAAGTISTGMEIIGPDRLEFMFDPTEYYLISDVVSQTVEIVEVE